MGFFLGLLVAVGILCFVVGVIDMVADCLEGSAGGGSWFCLILLTAAALYICNRPEGVPFSDALLASGFAIGVIYGVVAVFSVFDQ